jgi:hypothetical protein
VPSSRLVGARTAPQIIVAIQVVMSFGNEGNRLVALPLEDRVQYRSAEHFGKLFPMVMTKDIGWFNEFSASMSQALTACIPLSDHRSLCEEREIAGRPKPPWWLPVSAVGRDNRVATRKRFVFNEVLEQSVLGDFLFLTANPFPQFSGSVRYGRLKLIGAENAIKHLQSFS